MQAEKNMRHYNNHGGDNRIYKHSNNVFLNVPFGKLYVFPKHYQGANIAFECYLDALDRIDIEIAREFGLSSEDFMSFSVMDDNYNILSDLICHAETGNMLFSAESGIQLRIFGKVIGYGSPNDEREPIILVARIEMLEGKLEGLEDDFDEESLLDSTDDIDSSDGSNFSDD